MHLGVQAVLGPIVCVLVGVTLGTVGLIARAVFACRLKHMYAVWRMGMQGESWRIGIRANA